MLNSEQKNANSIGFKATAAMAQGVSSLMKLP
jgi:hypothetical protein